MATKNLAGVEVEVNEEGFLVNPDDWTEDIAKAIAKEEGIDELTDKHFKAINFLRSDFKANGQIATLRRLKNAGGISTKEMYDLFPDGPAKKSAKISGLAKPQGCV